MENNTSAASEGVPERVNCGTPPDHIWVHPWREVLYYSPTDQPGYVEYVRASVDEAAVRRAAERIVEKTRCDEYVGPKRTIIMAADAIAEIITTELRRDALISQHQETKKGKPQVNL